MWKDSHDRSDDGSFSSEIEMSYICIISLIHVEAKFIYSALADF